VSQQEIAFQQCTWELWVN